MLLFAIPRSPRWLVKKQRVDEARQVLELIGEDNPEKELQDIVNSMHLERAEEPLFARKYRLPIFLAVSSGGLRSVAITRAPRSANASAIAWPMPWPAPVTSATRPSCVLIGVFILPRCSLLFEIEECSSCPT